MTDSDAAPAPAEPDAAPKPSILARLARHGYGVLALLALLLWLPGIVSLPALDRDESRFAESSRQMLDSGNYVDIRFGQVPRYKKPVGIYWLQAAATAAVDLFSGSGGDHSQIWTYRLPSLAGGILALWLTLWSASVFGAEAGLIAGLLVAASLLLTVEAGMATTDAVLLASVMGAQGVLLRVYRAAKEDTAPPSLRLVLAGWAALAVGILVKGPVAPAVTTVTIIALVGWDTWLDRKAQQQAALPVEAAPEAKAAPARKAPAAKPAAAPEVKQAAAPEIESPAAPIIEPAAVKPSGTKINFRWLAHTRPLPGFALMLLLTAPWLIAIAMESHGAFFQQSLGGDFAAKLAGGQEGHGAPPGYYLLFSALSLWPAILFLLPGIGVAVTRRAEPAIRFLIAWAGATWLMMEAVPTKLPNYILPAFPPLAILAALWLLTPKDEPAATNKDDPAAAGPGPKKAGWRKWLPVAAALQFLIGLAAIAAAPLLAPGYYAPDAITDDWPLLLAVSLAALSGLVALAIFLAAHFLNKPNPLLALAPAFLAALILFPLLTAYVGPRLDQLWISQRLAVLVAKDRQAADPPPSLAGYEEPSLVFALGADVNLTDGRGAAERGAGKGGLALVDDQERPRFLARLAELEADAIAVDDLEGFNYSRGRRAHITLYRVSPLNPGVIPTVR
jgi:4-amino-4-deoxy-L-arabinose transferase-like glycosyltransferase